jgi:hypothetical protein
VCLQVDEGENSVIILVCELFVISDQIRLRLPYALKMEAEVHIYQTTRRLIPDDCDRNIHRNHRDFSEYRMRESWD